MFEKIIKRMEELKELPPRRRFVVVLYRSNSPSQKYAYELKKCYDELVDNEFDLKIFDLEKHEAIGLIAKIQEKYSDKWLDLVYLWETEELIEGTERWGYEYSGYRRGIVTLTQGCGNEPLVLPYGEEQQNSNECEYSLYDKIINDLKIIDNSYDFYSVGLRYSHVVEHMSGNDYEVKEHLFYNPQDEIFLSKEEAEKRLVAILEKRIVFSEGRIYSTEQHIKDAEMYIKQCIKRLEVEKNDLVRLKRDYERLKTKLDNNI